MKKVTNKIRVHHYPQIPCKPFIVEVADEFEAYKMQQTLTNQHLFLFENNIIPDYANEICIVMWDEDSDGEGNPGWSDYWNDQEEMDFDEFVETYIEN